MSKILKRTLKAFEGLDVNLDICIKEGCAFKINNNYCLTAYNYDTEKYYFDWICLDAEEIKDDFLNMNDRDSIIYYAGYTSLECYLDESSDVTMFSDIQSYNTWYIQFYEYSKQYTYTEIINILNSWTKGV